MKTWKKPSLTNLGVEATKTETDNLNLDVKGEVYCACCNEYFGNRWNDSTVDSRLIEHRRTVHKTEPGQPCPIS